MKKIRILLADDHTIMRMGLATLLESEPDMCVVGEAENGQVAVRLTRELKPDVVIMDLMMPVLSGAEATRLIREENPNVRIVVLTTFGSSAELALAVRNGAAATLLKDTETADLVNILRRVHEGKRVIPADVLATLDESTASADLTPRQLTILQSVTRGLSNADIAKQLGISEIGVKKHLQVIFCKLGAATRAEAAAIALRRQLLKA